MKNKKIAGFVLLCGVVLMVIAGVKLNSINREYSALNNYYIQQEKNAAAAESIPNRAVSDIDFDVLKAENKDIYAWLKIPSIQLSYPVLQGENNNTYLRRLPNGSYNVGGSLFIDERCPNDFAGPFTIIYGHTLRSGTMFSQLFRFEDADFRSRNNQIFLYTPDQCIEATIISCIEVNEDSQLYDLPESGDVSNYFQLCSRLFHVELSDEQQLLLLSTCSHAGKKARTVVIAVY